MKVRWNRSSLRLRISPSEMAALLNGEAVREQVAFPGGAGWHVAIVPADREQTRLSTLQGEVHLLLSDPDRERLADPESEGIYFSENEPGLDDASTFRYFIEKDFPCLHPRPLEALEPETETFAPPPGFAERKGV